MKPTTFTSTLAVVVTALVACGGSTSTSSSSTDSGADGASSGDSGSSDGSSSDGATTGDAASCTDVFAAAIDKQCTAATDCVLVNHDDCCGTLVMAVHAGTQASFGSAEQAWLACENGCGGRGCAHPDMAEDGQTILQTSPDGGTRTIVARCDTGRCMSHVE